MPEILTAVDISKALVIKGYMQPAELEWLAAQATTHERIAEIGSYYGRSTRALCDHTSGKVHAYDDFYGPRDMAMDYRNRMLIRENFYKNLADHLESGRLIVHDEDHEAVEPAGMFDMVFLDGGHEYFEFKHDLDTWMPSVAPSGLLCGHDYDLAYPGILRALGEVLGPSRVAIAPNTTIWYAMLRTE